MNIQFAIEMSNKLYKWPNDHFPFRVYFNSPNLRIFLIENIYHHSEWLIKYRNEIRETDFFLVNLGWYYDDWNVKSCHDFLEAVGLDSARFFILCPSTAEVSLFRHYGFNTYLVNHNCFLDENLFKIINSDKVYDAVYTARLTPFKRHYLSNNIENLALISGNLNGAGELEHIPKCRWRNSEQLNSSEVNQVLSKSSVGIILSKEEGACYSSSEYLLCGLPVVSTYSKGGRDQWYNDYNSIICSDNPEDIFESVLRLKSQNKNPEVIRNMHLELALMYRKNFINAISDIFKLSNINLDAENFYYENYIHKVFTVSKPDFDNIFK